MRFLAHDKKIHNLQENLVYYRIPADHNEKRPKIHWVNNYNARKRFGKHIWPFHQRLISLSTYGLISHIPSVFLNNLLDLKVVNKIRNITRY